MECSSLKRLNPYNVKAIKIKNPWYSRGFSDPAGTRTQDPNIKSVMLYQLSYRIVMSYPFFKGVQK